MGFPTFNIEVDPIPATLRDRRYTSSCHPATTQSPTLRGKLGRMTPSYGTWYSTTNLSSDFPGTPFACDFQTAGCNASWSQIQTAYPSARVRFGLGPNVGSGGNFVGNVDDFTVGTSTPANTTTFDFEPACTTVCYVSKTGSDSSTGSSPSQAFLTIQHAVNTVTAGGTVNVAAGTYNESVTINKAVTLDGANVGSPGTPRDGAESLVNRTAGQSGPVFGVATASPVTIDGFDAQFNGIADEWRCAVVHFDRQRVDVQEQHRRQLDLHRHAALRRQRGIRNLHEQPVHQRSPDVEPRNRSARRPGATAGPAPRPRSTSRATPSRS